MPRKAAANETPEPSPATIGSSGPTPGSQRVFLVDASNGAHGRTSGANRPTRANLEALLRALEKYPVVIKGVADASLRHKIDDRSWLEGKFADGSLEQVPAGTSADRFLWMIWKRYRAQGIPCFIVTNDRFPQTNAAEEGLSERPRVSFLMFDGEPVFEPPIESLMGQPGFHGPERSPPSPLSDLGTRDEDARSPALGERPPLKPGGQELLDTYEEVAGALRRGIPRIVNARLKEKGSEQKVSQHLRDAFARAIARRTSPEVGAAHTVNYATVISDLQHELGKDFLAKESVRKPRDVADRLADEGWLTLSHKTTTLFVSPTLTLEKIFRDQGLPRLQSTPKALAKPAARETSPPASQPPQLSSLPKVVEVSGREHGPMVSVEDPSEFLELCREHAPKLVFHWWCQHRPNDSSRWAMTGEFFFTVDGTTIVLPGRGYRSLGDFLEGRKEGFRGIEASSLLGAEDSEGYFQGGPRRDILEFHELDLSKYRASEGTVRSYAKARGFADAKSYLASLPRPASGRRDL